MAYDNVCKYLAERFPEQFAQWLMGEPVPLSVLDPTELSSEPIRADSLIFLQSSNQILHLEFQTQPKPELPFRMVDYFVRLYRRYPQVSIRQIIIYLRPSRSEWVYQTTFVADNLRHKFEVMRMWEQDPDALQGQWGLLPFLALAQQADPTQTLRAVANRIRQIPDIAIRGDITAATAVLAGIALEREVIRRILGEMNMRESVIYQEWREEALKEGLEQGLQQGMQAGLQQGKREVTLRQLNRKLGSLPPEVTTRIQSLSLSQVERLADDLLTFGSPSDLVEWLSQNG